MVSGAVVCPHEHVAFWKLLLAAAQHHEAVLYCMLLAWEKIQIQKFQVWFLLNGYHCGTIEKLKNP